MIVLLAALAGQPPETPRFTPVFAHAAALLTTMRATEALVWHHPLGEARVDGYRDTFTKPPLFDASRPFFEWDGDAWYINSIGHGVFGSELYFRARVCGFGVLGSFAWAASVSAVWEYGFEGNVVRPSANDLVWTPLSGLMFGEGRMQLFRAVSRIDDRALRGFAVSVVDPFGEIEHALTHDACGR